MSRGRARRPAAPAACAILLALAWAPPSGAQEVRIGLADIAAARPAGRVQAPANLGLARAVEIAIRQDPVVQQSAEAMRYARGDLQETRGAFDAAVTAAPALRFVRQSLPSSLWLSNGIGWFPPDAAVVSPLGEQYGTAGLGVGIARRFRSGATLRGDVAVESRQYTYWGAAASLLASVFDTTAQFHSSLSVSLGVPLQRGSRKSTEAPERARVQLLAAAEDDVQHTVAASALRTTLAYLRLVAAQERVRLMEGSVGRQERILAVTGREVELGDIARFELDRVRGRVARARSALSGSRTELVRARIDLARAMGAGPPEAGSQVVAVDSFLSILPPVEPGETLLARAVALRRDLRRSSEEEAAAAELEAGALSDLKRQVDLRLSAGMADLYDGGSVVGQPGGLGFTSPRGFYRSFNGRWQPFAAVSLTVGLPVGNSTARGRARQAEAARAAGAIGTSALDRAIRDNVVQQTGELREAEAALQHWEAGVASGEETLAAALARFADREITLLDLLQTEEALTADQLRLVDQRLAWASTFARLRFETGGLVTALPDGGAGRMLAFQPAGLVAPQGGERREEPR